MQSEGNQNWKVKLLVIGTVAGALIGLGTAYLMARTSEENVGGPPEISTADALRIGINAIGLIRGIAALGDGK
ncbi:MAG: hypothetical protein KBE23_08600 [Chloroflexi bacterium]|nr:hypothetical protein [Chloroflexota bacterium]MBP7042791.1 hypothetical protein [Chloroflexota bacterium]